MELFVIILRWGISVFCAIAGIVFGFDAIHAGISDIRQHNDTCGAIMGIILGLALFFILGMAFIYANPLDASLCGLN